ncbi:scavenger receptor class F member 2-like isoform X2 [Mizuhopecten yessoensis]|uniref:scavenger receptor class F member 2-like isoform X2 n=1 Tax=Mizuhopecten yessoensis TaxID=6573 RepID=UPI000B45898F|nr:scavenger receptor class F member 2-like isoform X2 [Mizuhopecten yessoensis]
MEFYLLATWSLLIAFTVVNASENIALGKVTRQSSIRDSWDSSKAVDGCVLTYMTSNCCTHTAGGQTEAWWQVDLQTQSVISSVNILYRDEDSLHRLAGYEVLLSNTRDWTTGSRCHKDITAEKASMSATQYITCAGVARYLAIYNDRRVKAKTWYSDDAILELCEVQVYGCPVGKYGNCNCNNDCMNCVNNICDATSGTCGDCTAGFYKSGGNCIPCPVNCLGNKCDSLNGACADGCTAGFSGTWCRCPVNCKDTICPDGQCTDCTDGHYGTACTPCPSSCSANTCNKTSGLCVQCVIGFYSSLCDQPCPSYCKNNVCNKDNGQCTECNDGFYGPACTPCPNGCRTNTCDKTSGHCDLCVAGFHGSQCLKACGNCQGLSCDMETGDRATGCTEGWTGDKCDTKSKTLVTFSAMSLHVHV